MTADQRPLVRRLRDAVEPVAANVYFAPEVHRAYADLGFGGSSANIDGVEMPDGVAYFTSRGACLGEVPGEVVAAGFGVFNPEVVVAAVTAGKGVAERAEVLQARADGATASLRRLLDAPPDELARATELLGRAAEVAEYAGRGLSSGLRSLDVPDGAVGALWRAADIVREHRGDNHILAWTAAGLDPVEIGLLTELYWGMPLKTYVRTRAWSADQLDAGIERLSSRGLIADGGFTEAGRQLREEVESTTDRLTQPLVDAMGDDSGELVEQLAAWSARIVEGHGYPSGARGILSDQASGES